MNIAPVSSSSSEDSGRGTDSEQHPSASSPVYHTAVHPAANNNWMSEPQWSLIRQQQQQQLKFNQQHVKLQHPRPAGKISIQMKSFFDFENTIVRMRKWGEKKKMLFVHEFDYYIRKRWYKV
jgi:hypothetical protein